MVFWAVWGPTFAPPGVYHGNTAPRPKVLLGQPFPPPQGHPGVQGLSTLQAATDAYFVALPRRTICQGWR